MGIFVSIYKKIRSTFVLCKNHLRKQFFGLNLSKASQSGIQTGSSVVGLLLHAFSFFFRNTMTYLKYLCSWKCFTEQRKKVRKMLHKREKWRETARKREKRTQFSNFPENVTPFECSGWRKNCNAPIWCIAPDCGSASNGLRKWIFIEFVIVCYRWWLAATAAAAGVVVFVVCSAIWIAT